MIIGMSLGVRRDLNIEWRDAHDVWVMIETNWLGWAISLFFLVYFNSLFELLRYQNNIWLSNVVSYDIIIKKIDLNTRSVFMNVDFEDLVCAESFVPPRFVAFFGWRLFRLALGVVELGQTTQWESCGNFVYAHCGPQPHITSAAIARNRKLMRGAIVVVIFCCCCICVFVAAFGFLHIYLCYDCDVEATQKCASFVYRLSDTVCVTNHKTRHNLPLKIPTDGVKVSIHIQ